jgi:hypothetical protein
MKYFIVCGYCGSINSFAICEEASRKDKLERLDEISKKATNRSR